MIYFHLYLGIFVFFALLVLVPEQEEGHLYWRGIALALLWPLLIVVFIGLVALDVAFTRPKKT